MKIHQFLFKLFFINITFPYMHEVILQDMNLVFLQYYQNTTYIHNYGYVSTFCDVFVAYYIIAISNFHYKAPSIALCGILFEKSHKKLCGTIFFKHSSKPWPKHSWNMIVNWGESTLRVNHFSRKKVMYNDSKLKFWWHPLAILNKIFFIKKLHDNIFELNVHFESKLILI